jgi:pSer/pThr/pTyr-binding forkhead associated (FHA) protein
MTMDVKLKVLSGKHTGVLIPLVGPQFLIGRADDCQLRTGSDLVSRHHCALLMRDSYLGIKDFGSRNGTLINGTPITQELELHSGDILKVGPLDFEVVIVYSEKGKKRPPVKDVADMAERTASAKSREVAETDLDSWLGEPEIPKPAANKFKLEDSQPVPSNADTVQMSNSGDTVPALNPNATPAKAKFVPPVPPKAATSQEAAMESLRRMIKKR